MVPPGVTHVTDALVEMLATASTLKVGDGEAPPDVEPSRPYLVVYAIPGGYSEDDAAVSAAVVWVVYQVTAVGNTRHEAEAARDAAHTAIVARTAGTGAFVRTVDGYHLKNAGATVRSLATHDGLRVCEREHDSTGGTTAEGSVFNAVERYRLQITPT